MAKAIFLAILTPVMLQKWGDVRFGIYALASSLAICLMVMDLGIRDATRLALSEADQNADSVAFRVALQRGVISYLLLAGLFLIIALILALSGVFSYCLHLSKEGDVLLCFTTLLTGLTVTAHLMIEPLAARGQVSLINMANAIGSITAIPLVGICLTAGGNPMAVMLVCFVCQSTPLIVLWVQKGLINENPFVWLHWSDYWNSYRSVGWVYLNNVVWLLRSHALPFIVSAVTGPAQAGIFFILIRISEGISVLGVVFSESLLSTIRKVGTLEELLEKFSHIYAYCLTFCGYGALVVIFLGHPLLEDFFHHRLMVTNWDLAATAALGLAGAWASLIFEGAGGLSLIKPFTLSSLFVGALTCLGCYLFLPAWGPAGVLAFATVAHLALGPLALKVTHLFEVNAGELWAWPLRPLVFPWLVSGILLWDAQMLDRPWVHLGVLAIVGVMALRDWHRLRVLPG